MRHRVALLLLFVVLTLAAPAVTAAAPPPDEGGSVVVQFASKAVQAQTEEGNPPSLEDQGYRRLEVPPGTTPEAFLARLKLDPDVLSANADVPVYAAAIPNDPFYAANQAAYMAAINAPAAWDLAAGNPAVVVAVLDSGTDLTHPEFAGRLWENERDANTNGIDDDGNGCVDDRYGCRLVEVTTRNASTGSCAYQAGAYGTGNVADDHGKAGAAKHSHGTLVAGILAAAGNNNTGIAGLAWNVKVMTVKVLDCGAFGEAPQGQMSDIAFGIDYARRMGARIISVSLASAPDNPSADAPVLRQAILNAEQAGVLIVAAAGNHGASSRAVGVGYPAAYTQFTNVVAVGGSDNAGRWANFSNYGPPIDLAAPSIDIAGPVRTAISPANAYGTDRGTSTATPLVSGMFALMMSRNPNLPLEEYLSIAKATATPAEPAPHGLNWAGAGIINAGAAVARVPMSINGTALHDWKDVPNGTEVRATVAGVECGLSRVQSVGPVARYQLRVRSEAEAAGCGAPGRTVLFIVGGQPAQPSYTWAGRDESLGLVQRDISTVSPPPGAIVVQALNGGWSNIAHLEAAGQLPNVLANLSSPWSELLRWDPAKPFFEAPGAYQRFARGVPDYVNDLPAIETFDAVWINAGQTNVATPNPDPAAGRVVSLQPGWNNFVYTGTAKSVAEALAPLGDRYKQVLQYDNGQRAWLSHLPHQPRYLNDFGGLFKLKVYWVFMTAPASLTMD